MSSMGIQRRICPGGTWRMMIPGIYAIGRDELPGRQREMTALLHAGPEGIVTGPYAVRHWGLAVSGSDYVEVLVPKEMRRRSIRFVRLIRTERPPEYVCLQGKIRFAGPARAAADAARGYRDPSQAQEVVCAVLRGTLCSLNELREELAAGPRQGSAMLRGALDAVGEGIWSAAEGDFLKLIKQSGLPQPEYNMALYTEQGEFLGIVDAWWGGAGVAAEVDSREYHDEDPADRETTMSRHNRIAGHLNRLLHFTPARIQTAGWEVVAEIRAAIAAGLPAAPTRIQAVPRHLVGASQSLLLAPQTVTMVPSRPYGGSLKDGVAGAGTLELEEAVHAGDQLDAVPEAGGGLAARDGRENRAED
jgi:hypothetical protein